MQIDFHQFHALLHSANLVESELRRHIGPLGIHPRQAQIIDALDRMGPVSQAELAAEFNITAASMSTMTDRLIASGYITRLPHPTSRRQNVLELTASGKALLVGIAKAWTAVDATLSAILGDNAVAFFAQARHLRDSLGGKIPGTTVTTDASDNSPQSRQPRIMAPK